jgi:hypothetical protein
LKGLLSSFKRPIESSKDPSSKQNIEEKERREGEKVEGEDLQPGMGSF